MKTVAIHTPGPWKIVKKTLWLDAEVWGNGTVALATVMGEEYDVVNGVDGESAANARLIASAPDLLVALENCRDWTCQYLDLPGHEAAAEQMLAVIDAAVSKATKGGA